MAWGWTWAVERKEPGCGAMGAGRVLRAPLKAKRPRGVVFYRLLNAATMSRNQEAGMAIFPSAAGLCSWYLKLLEGKRSVMAAASAATIMQRKRYIRTGAM